MDDNGLSLASLTSSCIRDMALKKDFGSCVKSVENVVSKSSSLTFI